jgi:hypothetical protein
LIGLLRSTIDVSALFGVDEQIRLHRCTGCRR